MRIGIDAYVTSAGMGGFVSYISHLCNGLAEQHPDDELLVYLPGTSAVELVFDQPNVVVRTVEFDPGGYPTRLERDPGWHQDALARAVAADDPDVFLGTSFFLPLRWPGPSVVTVHDLIFERHPEFFTPGNLELYTTWGRRAAERADGIVAVSESTAREVRTYWGDKPITVTPLSHSLRFIPTDTAESRAVVADRIGIRGNYVLSIAAVHQRKNLDGLVAAFAYLPKELRDNTTLLLVNLYPGRADELLQRHDIADRVVVTERIPDEVMPHVYRAARVLVHPAFYEGFGIPVLEAMACGTAVVGSTRPAIPEIAGDAALLVDPYDVDAIAGAMRNVLVDDVLRDRLGRAGQLRSTAFDWAETARLTRAALTDAIRRTAA